MHHIASLNNIIIKCIIGICTSVKGILHWGKREMGYITEDKLLVRFSTRVSGGSVFGMVRESSELRCLRVPCRAGAPMLKLSAWRWGYKGLNWIGEWNNYAEECAYLHVYVFVCGKIGRIVRLGSYNANIFVSLNRNIYDNYSPQRQEIIC